MDSFKATRNISPDEKLRQGTTGNTRSRARVLLLAILGFAILVVASNLMSGTWNSPLNKGGPAMITEKSLSGSARARTTLDPGVAQRTETATFALG